MVSNKYFTIIHYGSSARGKFGGLLPEIQWRSFYAFKAKDLLSIYWLGWLVQPQYHFKFRKNSGGFAKAFDEMLGDGEYQKMLAYQKKHPKKWAKLLKDTIEDKPS